jgi:ParB family chromosome partitioning protein
MTDLMARPEAEFAVGDQIAWERDGEMYTAEVRAISGKQVTTPIGNVLVKDPSLRKVERTAPAQEVARPGAANYATEHKPAEPGTKPPLREHRRLPVSAIQPFALQSRKEFAPEDLAELAESIQEHGLLEPIGVRLSRGSGAPWELVYGERRWRACQQAGLEEIHCVCFGELDDREAMAIHVEENERRSQLNPMERAEAFAKLRELGMSQSELGERLEVKQSTISRVLNLVKLPEDVKELLRAGKLTASHGEELLKWADRPALCSAIAEICAQRADPVRELQSGLPYSDVLKGKRLVRECGQHTVFSYHQASQEHRGTFIAGRYGMTFCLDVKLYDRLQKEAKADQEAHLAQLREKHLRDGKELVNTRGVPYGSFTEHDWKKTEIPGCGASCPCAQYHLNWEKKPAPICTNPKRLEELKAAERMRQRAERQIYLEMLLEQIVSGLREQGEISSRQLAYLAQRAFSNVPAKDLQFAAKLLDMDVSALITAQGWVQWHPAAEIPPAELYRLLVLFAVSHEAGRRLDLGMYGGRESRDLEWLLEMPLEPEGGTS